MRYNINMGRSLLLVVILLIQRKISVEGHSPELEAELQADRKFLHMGVDRLGGQTTTERHAAVLAIKPEATRMSLDYRERLLGHLSRKDNSVPTNCPPVPSCDEKAVFRTADGSCNNLDNPTWGKSFIPMRRVINPEYDDDLFTPREKGKDGVKLRSPREISRVLHVADMSSGTENKFITHMTMQWAQFLDHDLTLAPIFRGADGAAITCCEEDVQEAAKAAGLSVTDRYNSVTVVMISRSPSNNRIVHIIPIIVHIIPMFA